MKARLKILALLLALPSGMAVQAAAQERARPTPAISYAARDRTPSTRGLVRAVPHSRDSRIDPLRGYGRRDHLRRFDPPTRLWVEGHFQTVSHQVWVPEHVETIWIDPVYEERHDPCGNTIRVLVRAGCWRDVVRPGHFETRCQEIWVPGHWELH